MHTILSRAVSVPLLVSNALQCITMLLSFSGPAAFSDLNISMHEVTAANAMAYSSSRTKSCSYKQDRKHNQTLSFEINVFRRLWWSSGFHRRTAALLQIIFSDLCVKNIRPWSVWPQRLYRTRPGPVSLLASLVKENMRSNSYSSELLSHHNDMSTKQFPLSITRTCRFPCNRHGGGSVQKYSLYCHIRQRKAEENDYCNCCW